MPLTIPAINVDCWLIIIDQLYGDFQTLSRLLQVSQLMLTLTAPKLYGQLGDSSAAQQRLCWSERKRNRLSALLLVSSGYNFTDWRKKYERVHGNQSNAQDEIWVPWTRLKGAGHCVYFKFPLFVDYFSFLKRVSPELMGEQIWDRFMNPFYWYENWNYDPFTPKQSEEFTIQLAKVITEIRMGTVQEIQFWMIMVNHLSQLSMVHILQSLTDELFSEEFKSTMIAFVKAHGMKFPKARLTVNGRPGPISQEDHTFLLELMEIVGPETDKVHGLAVIEAMMVSDDWQLLARNLKSFEFKVEYAEQWDDGLTTKDLSVMNHVARFLEKCPKLQTLKLWETEDPNRPWTDLFAWAKNERALLDEEKARYLGHGKEKQQAQQQEQQKSLMKLRDFEVINAPSIVAIDVIDLFRHSIERISIDEGGLFGQRLSITWSWSLTRLTSLRLVDCQFQFRRLEYCPVLQDLSLRYCQGDDMISGESDLSECLQWRLSSSIRRLEIIRGKAAGFLDLDSLWDAQELEELNLTYDQEKNKGGAIKHNITRTRWTLPRLKKLTLGTADNVEFWQGTLLKAAANLKMYSTPTSWLDLRNDFMSVNEKLSKIVLSTGGNDQAEDKVNDEEIPIISTTKIRRLEFGEFYTLHRLEHLWNYLGEPQMVSPQELLSISTIGKMNEIKSELGFPYLTCMVFKAEGTFHNREIAAELITPLKALVLMLMKRPRMRLIELTGWTPSETFVGNELMTVDEWDVPGAHDECGCEAGESAEERKGERCLLKTITFRNFGVFSEYFQLGT